MKIGQALKIANGEEWIIPRYDKYMTGTRVVADERDALVQIMTRPLRIRTNTFSASGAGSCLRSRQFAYIGTKKSQLDSKTARIFAHGDYVHLKHQVAGIIGGYLTDAEVSYTNDEYLLSGTADGITSEGDIAEFKSINSRGYSGVLTYGPLAKHILQVNSYMVLSGITTARIVYENKDDQSLKEFRIDQDKEQRRAVIDDLETLVEATLDKKLLPMLPACRRKEGFEYKWCPNRDVCPLFKEGEWPSE